MADGGPPSGGSLGEGTAELGVGGSGVLERGAPEVGVPGQGGILHSVPLLNQTAALIMASGLD